MTIPDSFKGLGIVVGTKQDNTGNVSAEEMAAFKGKEASKCDGGKLRLGRDKWLALSLKP